MVQTFDPELSMGSVDREVEPEGIVASIIEDGEWHAGCNTGEDGEPVSWGIAKYGEVFYLWTGPYAAEGGTARFQVDTYTIGPKPWQDGDVVQTQVPYDDFPITVVRSG